MYKSFMVKNFRCLADIEIEPLERINLIAGKNNVGKTALLEALWLHHGTNIPDLARRVNSFRGLEKMDLHCTLSVLVMNAMALSRAKAGQFQEIRVSARRIA